MISESEQDQHRERRYRASCLGKIAHGSQESAWIAYENMWLTGNLARRDADVMNAYQCEFCGFWHLGKTSDWFEQLKAFAKYARKLQENLNAKWWLSGADKAALRQQADYFRREYRAAIEKRKAS